MLSLSGVFIIIDRAQPVFRKDSAGLSSRRFSSVVLFSAREEEKRRWQNDFKVVLRAWKTKLHIQQCVLLTSCANLALVCWEFKCQKCVTVQLIVENWMRFSSVCLFFVFFLPAMSIMFTGGFSRKTCYAQHLFWWEIRQLGVISTSKREFAGSLLDVFRNFPKTAVVFMFTLMSLLCVGWYGSAVG